MRLGNLSAIDLNLLVGLDALLRERSVTAAATRLGLSQPAMSRALGRLRDLFEDPLLVRTGHEMVPTPRALALREPLSEALASIRRTLEPSAPFDPGSARRSFVLCALDTTQVVILPRLLPEIGRLAPGIDVETRPLDSGPETFAALAEGRFDIAVGRFESVPSGFRRAELYRDRVVCLVRSDHPRIGEKLDLAGYLAESHLASETVARHELPFTLDELLATRGLERRVTTTVSNLALAPLIVSRTDLICTAVSHSVAPFASALGVRTLDPPFEVPDIELHLIWHERNELDEGHRWLRDQLAAPFRPRAAAETG